MIESTSLWLTSFTEANEPYSRCRVLAVHRTHCKYVTAASVQLRVDSNSGMPLTSADLFISVVEAHILNRFTRTSFLF